MSSELVTTGVAEVLPYFGRCSRSRSTRLLMPDAYVIRVRVGR
jgi:hypothetical protein